MSAKTKGASKGKEAQPNDDLRTCLTEGILRPASPVPSSEEETFSSFRILPEKLMKWATSSDPFPEISKLSIPNIYPILGNILGVNDYQYNMLSYWFIDIIAEAIRIAQDELLLSMPSQKLMVAWFVNILRAIKEKNLSREEVYQKVNLTVVTAEVHAPCQALGVPPPKVLTRDGSEEPKPPLVIPRPTRSFQSVEMYSIAGLLWHIFANPFQYEVIKKVFCDSPPVQDIHIPYEINQPKPYKPPPVPEKRASVKKPEKKKGKAMEDEITEEEIMAKIEREKDLYILPLQEAVNEEYFVKLFNVERIPEAPKTKGKAEKKKK